MNQFTHRQYKILAAIAQANDHIISKELTDTLSITRRTLISDIKSINAEDKLIDSDNRGYFINPAMQKHIDDILLVYQNTEENDNAILKYLLIARNKVQIDQIADELFLSKSSLQKHITKCNNIIAEYQLHIVRHQRYLSIEGEENNKRLLMARIIHKESNSFFDDINNLSSYFPNIEVAKVSNKIIEIVEKHQYYIPQYYEMNFLINILVILSRNPYLKESGKETFTISDQHPEYQIAQAILQMMAIQYRIHYINPSQVIQELDRGLYGFIFPQGHRYDTPIDHFLSDSFKTCIRKILEQVFHYYYLHSINYESFLNVFCIHVSELIKRCTNSQTFTPTNISIKQCSPYIYEVAVSIAQKLSETFHIKIPENEINLIAMHIGYAIEQVTNDTTIAPIIIIAENYHNIGTKIAEKLTKRLADKVQIMGFYHSFDEVPYREYKEYFILSSVQYTQDNAKICYISPFFTEQDMQRVMTMIDEYIKKRSREQFMNLFDTYISDDCFFVLHQKMDKYEAIRFLCDQAYEHGDVNRDYYHQVLEREKYSCTSFYGKFAIPHSNIQNANITKLYIMVNYEGVIWDEENIKLIFLILINHEAAADFRKLYSGITETLYHSDIVFNHIDKIKNMEDLKQYLLM